MAVSAVCKLRAAGSTFFCRVSASGPEGAAGRHVQRTWYITFKNDTLFGSCNFRIRDWHSREERFGIGMDRIIHELVGVSQFHHMT